VKWYSMKTDTRWSVWNVPKTRLISLCIDCCASIC